MYWKQVSIKFKDFISHRGCVVTTINTTKLEMNLRICDKIPKYLEIIQCSTLQALGQQPQRGN